MATPRKTDPHGPLNRGLDRALASVWSQLRQSAADPARFQRLIDAAFASAGTGRSAFLAASETLRQDLLAGSDLGLRFTLRDASVMGGARAAFGQDESL